MYIVNTSAPPSVPTIKIEEITVSSIRVNWTSDSVATSYNVSINGNTTFLPANVNRYTFSGLTSNTTYTVSVVAINCAGNRSFTFTNSTSKLFRISSHLHGGEISYE